MEGAQWLLNFDAKFAPNVMKISPKYHKKSVFAALIWKFMQISYQKGAGTKMHTLYIIGLGL